jgi:thiol-disulfide isomerase/thioredoxin
MVANKLLRGALAAALAVALSFSVSGCANDSLADQFKAGGNKNYIAGDGTVSEFAEVNRGKPVSWSGPTESGGILKSDQLTGVVVVMNYWYAGCAPCRAEAPDLVEVNKMFVGKNVQFVGVNVRDSAATALAFDRTFNVTWPSILDSQSGSVLLAFTGLVTPQAVPTTLVIDKKGRVAARVLGQVEASTLKALIQRVVDEK